MMKKLFVLTLLVTSPSLFAAPVTMEQLKKYAEHALPQCAGQAFKVEPINQPGSP